MRAFVLYLFLAPGCDFVEPGECTSPGFAFGPCIASECIGEGLACFSSKSGDLCVPPGDTAVAPSWELQECAAWRGDLGYVEEIEHFAVVCPDGDECKGGTVCDSHTKICVYPYP